METIIDRYENKIFGALSCYDRLLIVGTIPGACYAEGMTMYLARKGIRVFDYPQYAEQLTQQIRQHIQNIAHENGLPIEHIGKKGIRKESVIQKILQERGAHPGLVHIISAMETCPAYRPWHNKKTHKTYLIGNTTKCLHYYVYFIDEDLGLCHVRIPTWPPFKLQVCFNGHNWLENQLKKENISYKMIDNAFVNIDDFQKAQELADTLKVEQIHQCLNRFAECYCPLFKEFGVEYHWSISQAEYATDIVFKRQQDLKLIYGQLTRTAIHSVKPENIATFLGKKLNGNYQGEMGNNFNTRIEGTRIKHTMGSVSVKMYDKYGIVLRIETTTNDLNFFKHYREVEQKDGTKVKKFAPMKKGVYSLSALRELFFAANRRYIDFISSIEDNSAGTKKLEKLSEKVSNNNGSFRGINFFRADDLAILMAIARGEFNINGFQNKNIRQIITARSSAQISRLLKGLQLHGLIKKAVHSYKYYLTKLGRRVIATGLKLRELVIIPTLATTCS